jgi:trigger factor
MAVKVETERKSGSQVVLSVEVPEDQVQSSIDRAYQRLAPRVKVAGFRPGKAPRPMVERQIGWSTLRQEALELLLDTAYVTALNESGIKPLDDASAQLEVEQFERGMPFRFKATLSVKPEVSLEDYHDIRVPRPRTEVLEQEVNETLERLRAGFAELHPVERPVATSDFVTADIHMMQGGAVLVGESQTDYQFEVDPQRLRPAGLAEGLVGASQGDTRDVRIRLPADYPKRTLAGSDVTFRVAVKSVKERRLPPLDDDLARLLARKEDDPGTLEGLRSAVREDLEDAAARSDEIHFEDSVLNALNERTQVEVPEVLVDRETDRQVRNLELRLGDQGMRLDRYLAYTNQTLEQLKQERRSLDLKKVRIELALEAVGEREGLTVPDAQVEEAVNAALADDPQLAQRTSARTLDLLRDYLRHQLLMRRTIDYLTSLASSETSDTMNRQPIQGEPSKPDQAAANPSRRASRAKEA